MPQLYTLTDIFNLVLIDSSKRNKSSCSITTNIVRKHVEGFLVLDHVSYFSFPFQILHEKGAKKRNSMPPIYGFGSRYNKP